MVQNGVYITHQIQLCSHRRSSYVPGCKLNQELFSLKVKTGYLTHTRFGSSETLGCGIGRRPGIEFVCVKIPNLKNKLLFSMKLLLFHAECVTARELDPMKLAVSGARHWQLLLH